MGWILRIVVFFFTAAPIIWPIFSRGAEANSDSKPISLEHRSLTKIKNSGIAKAVESIFESESIRPKHCPECAETFSGANEYLSLLQKPFLLVDMEPNEFGGYFLLVAFKNHPRLYRLWFYQTEKKQSHLREMSPFGIELNDAVMKELANEKYAPFWSKI